MNFRKLLALLLVFAIAPMGAFATDYTFSGGTASPLSNATIAPNLAEFKSLPLEHKVSRKSSFAVAQQTAQIQEVGDTTIAIVNVINNTKDGYHVFIEAENGHLKPDSDLDGETNIPYSLAITHTGVVGVGMDTNLAVATTELEGAASHKLVNGTTGDQQSATDAEFTVALNGSPSLKATMSMAGTYTDTITFIYEDL
jgi:hypothetical protein